jgi:hypothetical protein
MCLCGSTCLSLFLSLIGCYVFPGNAEYGVSQYSQWGRLGFLLVNRFYMYAIRVLMLANGIFLCTCAKSFYVPRKYM